MEGAHLALFLTAPVSHQENLLLLLRLPLPLHLQLLSLQDSRKNHVITKVTPRTPLENLCVFLSHKMKKVLKKMAVDLTLFGPSGTNSISSSLLMSPISKSAVCLESPVRSSQSVCSIDCNSRVASCRLSPESL